MKPRRIAYILLLLPLLAACSTTRTAAPLASRTVDATPPPASHVVARGDTLYSIAWHHGLDFHDVARWNGIGAPYVIHPGQTLFLRPDSRPAPVVTTKTPPPPARPTARAAPPPRPAPPAVRPPATRTAPIATTPPPVIAAQAASRRVGGITWRWPTRGKLVSSYRAGDPARKGIDVGGTEGQPIHAASGGRVVYSGNGLVGYGNLVIIRHGERYLSAYGHNRELLVREGDSVAPGQLIAKMGRVDNGRALLHFEVRRDGKPIDPLKVLPRG